MTNRSEPERRGGRIAAIDYGRRRLGIALADRQLGIATPYASLARAPGESEAAHFRKLVQQEHIEQFVVGLPVHLSGEESPMSAEARQFAAWLEKTTGVPVELFDERFTSVEAEQHLAAAGLTRAKRKARIDKVAAQILLASYIELRQKPSEPPGPLHDRSAPQE